MPWWKIANPNWPTVARLARRCAARRGAGEFLRLAAEVSGPVVYGRVANAPVSLCLHRAAAGAGWNRCAGPPNRLRCRLPGRWWKCPAPP